MRERIIAWQIFYCLLTGLGVASTQLIFHFLDKRDHALEIIANAADSHIRPLAHALIERNMPAVRAELDAIGGYPMVGYVILTLPSGEIIKAGRQTERQGHLILDKFSSLAREVKHPAKAERSIGSLRVYANCVFWPT